MSPFAPRLDCASRYHGPCRACDHFTPAPRNRGSGSAGIRVSRAPCGPAKDLECFRFTRHHTKERPSLKEFYGSEKLGIALARRWQTARSKSLTASIQFSRLCTLRPAQQRIALQQKQQEMTQPRRETQRP